MDKYIIVTTFCGSDDVANKIIDALLEKKLVAGSQKSMVHSKYWWNNGLEECDEYKLEFRTKSRLLDEIAKEIKRLHDYEVAEVCYREIETVSQDYLQWIDESVKNN